MKNLRRFHTSSNGTIRFCKTDGLSESFVKNDSFKKVKATRHNLIQAIVSVSELRTTEIKKNSLNELLEIANNYNLLF